MNGIDTTTLQTLYALRDPALVQLFIGVSGFGSTVVIGGISLVVGITLLVRKRLSYFTGLCVSVIGTILVVFPLKEIIARARPDILYQAYAEHGFSFPSGHASFSIALYGFLAYLAWRTLPRTQGIIAITVATAAICLIGFSRLYLGVHFPSDVVGGYIIGGTLLALGIWISERLKTRPIWS